MRIFVSKSSVSMVKANDPGQGREYIQFTNDGIYKLHVSANIFTE